MPLLISYADMLRCYALFSAIRFTIFADELLLVMRYAIYSAIFATPLMLITLFSLPLSYVGYQLLAASP